MTAHSDRGLLGKIRKVLLLAKGKSIQAFRWYKATYKNARWYGKIGIVAVSLVAAFIIYLGMVDINFLWLFGKSPSWHTITHPKQSVASVIYSSDGKVMGRFFRENRTPVKYEEIPAIMIRALIDTEDERFYKHHGIDAIGLGAAVKDMVVRHDARGASTITQQLAKNMFKTRSNYSAGLLGYIPGVRMLIMKTKEWITAIRLEMAYSKEDILTMYLNTVDFGSNAYGIRAAAQTYFSTTPKDLTTDECAVLVGMLKATTYYSPRINPENSLRRRNVVLNNLLVKGDLSREEYDELVKLPITLRYHVATPYEGNALYFREALADSVKSLLSRQGYEDVDVYGDGLKIYTTLDSRMQKYAEEAVMKQMKQVQRNFNNEWGKQDPWRDANGNVIPNFIEDIAKRTDTYKDLTARYPDDPDSVTYYMNQPRRVRVFDYDKGEKYMELSPMDSIRYMVRFMHCGFLAVEPQTGNIKAWVGDVDFSHWKYDKVTAHRQPGSTFKLFVYTAAMEYGLGPCDERVDEWRQYDAFDKDHKPIKWTPRNAEGYYSGSSMTLKYAFARSINSVAVAVAEEVGLENVINVAHRIGERSPLHTNPSMALGSDDVTLYELVNSYSTVMNDGKYNNLSFVTRIEDSNGNVLYEQRPLQQQVITYESAFLMQQMLRGGMTEPGGTSQALWGYDIHRFGTNFGGKTGTTSNNSDGWYVGVTKNLVGGCWVGGEYRSIHFRSGRMGQGSRTALPVYAYFMEKVLKDPSLAQYRGNIPDQPSQAISRSYNCQTAFEPDTLETDSLSLDSAALNGIDHVDLEDLNRDEEQHRQETEEGIDNRVDNAFHRQN